MASYSEAFQPPDLHCSSNPSSERPIDLVHLARKTMGDKDAETQVLGLFARQARQCVNQLCGANHMTAQKDRLAVVRTLYGSASNVGAFCVSRAAKCLEEDPNDGILHDALSEAVLDVENFISGLSR